MAISIAAKLTWAHRPSKLSKIVRNFIWAVGALIIVIVGVFLLTSKQNATQDTVIPSPQSVFTPSPDVANLDLNKSEGTKMDLPFEVLKKENIEGKKVDIETNKGLIVIELFADTPIASSNFIYLVDKKFYDGLVFHRVIKDFMLQGGDPLGNGTGGPGYNFADEPVNQTYKRGVVAMANAGPNTNGSQFFIMHKDYQLPPKYTIFGRVVSGMEVVDELANSNVDGSDKPIEKVVMNKVSLE